MVNACCARRNSPGSFKVAKRSPLLNQERFKPGGGTPSPLVLPLKHTLKREGEDNGGGRGGDAKDNERRGGKAKVTGRRVKNVRRRSGEAFSQTENVTSRLIL